MNESDFKLAKELRTLLANISAQAESLLHSLERATSGIGLHINADKTEYMSFNQRGSIYTLRGGPLKLVDRSTYLINQERHQNATSKGMDSYR